MRRLLIVGPTSVYLKVLALTLHFGNVVVNLNGDCVGRCKSELCGEPPGDLEPD